MAAPIQEGDVIGKVNVCMDSDDKSEDSGKLDMASASPGKKESVSMFCKSCLGANSGQQKQGTFVLKCTNCGHTDTVLEEGASELDPEEFTGSIMMNRFLQIFRDQEATSINISDPEFADDKFTEMTSAMSDFSEYVNMIAKRVSDIVKRSAMQSNMDNSDSNNSLGDKNEEDGVEVSNPENASRVDNEIMLDDCSMDEINALQSSVPKFIALVIAKYRLPVDIWKGIDQRLRNPEAGCLDAGDDVNGAQDANNDKNMIDNVGNGADTMCAVTETDKSDNVHGVIYKNSNQSTGHEESEMSSAFAENAGSDNGMTDTIFGVNRKDVRVTLHDEVVVNLGSKLKVNCVVDKQHVEDSETSSPGFKAVESPDGRQEHQTAANEDKDGNNVRNARPDIEIPQKSKTVVTFHHESDAEFDKALLPLRENMQTLRDLMTVNQKTKEVSAETDGINVEMNNTENTNTPKEKPMSEGEASSTQCEQGGIKSDGYEVHFQAIAAAFLAEMQSRKTEALVKRRQKALAMVAAKKMAIKEQIKMVERNVTEELDMAYETKRQKNEKHRQRLAEKQKDLANLEDLFNYYIQTGQMDKARELAQAVYSANQKN